MVTDIVIAVAVVILAGVYVSWRAGRLDRLHTRLETARAALDATLVRRSSVALELASSGLLDPAASLLLAGAAHEARGSDPRADGALDGEGRPRELAESDLTKALRAVFGQPGFRASLAGRDGADELLAELEAAAHQVFLARKFYNDAVAVTRHARRRPLVRLLRLAGNAGLPEFFEIDDSPFTEESPTAPAFRAELSPVPSPSRGDRTEPALPPPGGNTIGVSSRKRSKRGSACPLSIPQPSKPAPPP